MTVDPSQVRQYVVDELMAADKLMEGARVLMLQDHATVEHYSRELLCHLRATNRDKFNEVYKTLRTAGLDV